MPRLGIDDAVLREREAVSAHVASLRGAAAMSRPEEAPKGSFAHGFFLPFSLIVAALRDPELRGPYARTTLVRLVVVAALTAIGLTTGTRHGDRDRHGPVIMVHHDVGRASAPIHVDVPGVKVDLNDAPNATSEVKVLGQALPVVDVDEAKAKADANTDANANANANGHANGGAALGVWKRLLAVFATIAAASWLVVGLSRRYDDWIGHGVSAIAAVRAEDATRKTPRIALDVRWLFRRLKMRVRYAVAFAAGMPAIALFQAIPTIGDAAFQVASVAWAWYWLGIGSAAKSVHVFADEDHAPPPRLVRGLRDFASRHWLLAPLRVYASLWAWIGRKVGFDAPAAVFERTPAPFLGLVVARAVLSLPGLYVLAKPIIPVAAGRLIAEADPLRRFAVSPRATTLG